MLYNDLIIKVRFALILCKYNNTLFLYEYTCNCIALKFKRILIACKKIRFNTNQNFLKMQQQTNIFEKLQEQLSLHVKYFKYFPIIKQKLNTYLLKHSLSRSYILNSYYNYKVKNIFFDAYKVQRNIISQELYYIIKLFLTNSTLQHI